MNISLGPHIDARGHPWWPIEEGGLGRWRLIAYAVAHTSQHAIGRLREQRPLNGLLLRPAGQKSLCAPGLGESRPRGFDKLNQRR